MHRKVPERRLLVLWHPRKQAGTSLLIGVPLPAVALGGGRDSLEVGCRRWGHALRTVEACPFPGGAGPVWL